MIKDDKSICKVDDVEMKKMNAVQDNAIIMLVAGFTPTLESVNQFVKAGWNHVVMPKIHFHEEGYFVMQLQNKEDYN